MSLPSKLLASLWIWASLIPYSSVAADEIWLQLKTNGSSPVIEWQSRIALPISANYSEYRIERSTVLTTNAASWQMVAGPFAGNVGISDDFLRHPAPASGNYS